MGNTAIQVDESENRSNKKQLTEANDERFGLRIFLTLFIIHVVFRFLIVYNRNLYYILDQ